jgi:hypothetical protein
MLFAVPLVAKVLAGFAASELGAAPAAQSTDPQKIAGAANVPDFTQTIDNLDRAASGKAAHAAAADVAKI